MIFFEVDLQADHEEEEDQPEFRDRGNGFLPVDELESGRPEREARREIGENDRLLEKLREHAERPCGDDAERDIREKLVHGRRSNKHGSLRGESGKSRGDDTVARAKKGPDEDRGPRRGCTNQPMIW